MDEDDMPTPGPWFLVATAGTDFTAIARRPTIEGSYDCEQEILGASEWLRGRNADLALMARAPEMQIEINRLRASTVHPERVLAALRRLSDVVAQRAPHLSVETILDDVAALIP